MSGDAELGPAEAGWRRLREAVSRAEDELRALRQRAVSAEMEAERLRALMEGGAEGMSDELRRLRSENAELRERSAQARERLLTVARRIRRLEEKA